jgi:hypothetical protein
MARMQGEFDGAHGFYGLPARRKAPVISLATKPFLASQRKLTPLLEMRGQSLTRSQFFFSKLQSVK